MMTEKVVVPDIGDIKDVEVIEILIQPGEEIDAEQSLITLETDKAVMEVPAPFAGTVKKVALKVGDRVSQGTSILEMDIRESDEPSIAGGQQAKAKLEPKPDKESTLEVAQQSAGREPPITSTETPVTIVSPVNEASSSPLGTGVHAGPSVRRFARELGADLSQVRGTGRKGRIVKGDVKRFVKEALNGPDTGLFDLQALFSQPEIDFSRFGEIELRSLSRIRKISADRLRRSWLGIPHVTQHGDADITALEALRKKRNSKSAEIHLTLLPFLMKAVVAVLQRFPDFNASLGPGGEELILKKYYHIGIAVDTPDGLVVPVLRNVDDKEIRELAGELAEMSARAREKKLRPSEMQGGTFTISSLGGIGGTAFTPIINNPEVAILGVSRARLQGVFEGGDLCARMILPLSLSYDHRVIDGAAAARFVVFLGDILARPKGL
jgi:pyruvate dehydrogenase E2 component (dihydrolipoamide acetyltransferase)